ncbi:MAG: sodium-dependent transporter [Endomicrobium sp.]|jgi:NSS family neurotransmitter:Na+ symporter|nr:sodium-dependent transporter [Endomicrobium sp.]
MPNSVKDLFSSKWGFIFAAAGSAIGMGNIWLFPYRIGELGGAVFLIPYIICVAVLGFTAVIGEITIGRLTGTGPVGAFKKALELRGNKGTIGECFGWFSVLVVLTISLGYTVVVSWIMRFLTGALTGSAFITSNSTQYFDLVANNQVLLWVIMTLVLVGIAMIKGIENGIERVSKFMIPAFLILFLILVVRVAFLPGAFEGYKYLFVPRWEFLFNTRTWIFALGQSFYSLSIFGSIMVVYGSYAKKSEDIVFSARNIVVLDTLASIIASLMIIPAVFAFSKNINAGPSLMFITMPDIFKTIPFGQVFMIIFFTAVFFAAITSLISILEVVVEAAQSKFKMPRYLAVGTTILVAIICNAFICSNIGRFTDILEIHFIPFCALTCGIFIFWIIPSKNVIEEIQKGHSKSLGNWIIPMGRYVFCSLVILIYILNILHLK